MPGEIDVVVNESRIDIVHTTSMFPVEVPGTGGGGGGSFSVTFTDADLSVADLLPVTHNLNRYPAGVFVQDADGEQVGPDAIEVTSVNALALNLASFRPLTGTWRVQVT